MAQKVIFLVDMNAFFASVHQAQNPELKGQPVLVAGNREARTGVVLAKSYECLERAPIRTAMTLKEALDLLPEAVVVQPDHRMYREYSRRVRRVLEDFSPLVEPVSIDEAFLDMTGTEKLFGPPEEAARKIQDAVLTRTGLPCSVGIGNTRIAAKMASEFKKPMGISTLWPPEVPGKLYPLPVGKLHGVGEKSVEKLAALNIRTIGELAEADGELLIRRFGAAGRQMRLSARGLGADDVDPSRYDEVKSIGNSRTMDRDLSSLEELRRALYDVTEIAAARLRKQGMVAATVCVSLKDSRFVTRSHRKTYGEELCLTEDIYERAAELLEELWKPGTGIRLVGVSLENLSLGEEVQIRLLPEDPSRRQLQNTLDRIRDRYGDDSVLRGRSLLPGSLRATRGKQGR